MKKIIAILLAITAFAAALAGCSGKSDSNSDSSSQSSQAESSKKEDSSQSPKELKKTEQEYFDKGLHPALDGGISRPYYIWFPNGTMPKSRACGYTTISRDGVIPICAAGSLEWSPEFDVDVTQVKTNEDIIPVMKNIFSELVAYAKLDYKDNVRIEISNTENKTVKDMETCYSKGEYFFDLSVYSEEQAGFHPEERKFQFVAYSLMWDTDTPFFVAVLDTSEEQNKLAECEEALEFMINSLRESDLNGNVIDENGEPVFLQD